MTGITSGGGGGYDYVETYYPSGADEGESLYHLTDDAAFVFNGSEWVEQTVTDHGQLSGVSEGDHRNDSRVSDLAPVQSVNGSTGNVAIQEVPSGVITMWSGSVSNIPDGWTLCDGTDGTPDLTDRFVVGAGGQYTDGDTGGADSVQLTESEMPSHNHEYNNLVGSEFETNYAAGSAYGSEKTTTQAGGDQPHENRPPYYALAFIMKT